jgi:hypothetical protein
MKTKLLQVAKFYNQNFPNVLFEFPNATFLNIYEIFWHLNIFFECLNNKFRNPYKRFEYPNDKFRNSYKRFECSNNKFGNPNKSFKKLLKQLLRYKNPNCNQLNKDILSLLFRQQQWFTFTSGFP